MQDEAGLALATCNKLNCGHTVADQPTDEAFNSLAPLNLNLALAGGSAGLLTPDVQAYMGEVSLWSTGRAACAVVCSAIEE